MIFSFLIVFGCSLFRRESYNVKDWRVWLFSLLGFVYSLVMFFVIVQPVRLWFLVPHADKDYSNMLGEHKGDVFVYVMDSGVDVSIDDWLSEHSVVGYDAIRDRINGTRDCIGHGTKVASVVGSNAVNNGVTVVPVKTADCSLVNDPVAIVRGLNWIVDNHPKGGPVGVINMSFGYIDDVPFLDGIQNAVKAALDAGFIVVASAGNNSKVDTVTGEDLVADACNEVPANVSGVVAVGAASLSFIEGNVQRATFSNSGSCVSLFAQGVEVRTSMKNESGEVVTGYVDGTSFAAPYVSAAVANKLVVSPWWGREEAVSAVKADAVKNVIVARVSSPLEPNIAVKSDSGTPNLFLEYDFEKFKPFLEAYSEYYDSAELFTVER